MTTVFLVRHGETVWHAENRYAGSSDIALTPHGVDQATALGEWARSAELSAIVTSDLQRAIDTAQPSAQALGIAPTVDPRLRELDFGKGEGLTRAEMRQRFAAAVDAFVRAPADAPLPGGEDPHAAARRLRAAFDSVCAAHPDGRVMLVLHSTAMRLLLCDLLGLDLNEYRRAYPSIANVALTSVKVCDGRVDLLGFNQRLGA